MPILINKVSPGGSVGLTSTGVITDGLTVYYNPTFPASYPGSGTSLSDLSGNGFTSTLNNGTAFSSVNGIKSISFDGVDDYAVTSGTPTSLQGNSEFTVCGWFKRTGTLTNRMTWGIGANSTAQGLHGFSNTTNDIGMGLWNTAAIWPSGQTYPLNEWKFCAWQKKAGVFSKANVTIWSNLTSYTDTDLSISGGDSTVPNINSAGVFLGNGATGTYNGSVDISVFMIYNRVLTSAEITRTYNATKTYVGL